MLKFKLQMFGEGEGGEASAPSTTEGGENIPSSVPPRARKLYAETVNANKSTVNEEKTEKAEEKPETKMSYADLIKSDDYKEEHEAYMKSAISDRLKKYKGIESENKQMKEALLTVAQKYGIEDGNLEALSKAIAEDDSYYEKYATEHDMLPNEARRLVTLERKAKAFEEEQEARRQEEVNMERIRTLNQNAEKTKLRFPSFDLETEMRNPGFLNICASTNGDTTAAYIACHHDEIINGVVRNATKEAQVMVANTIASGQSRPIENGLSAQSAVQTTVDFKNMSLDQLRAYANAQRLRR